MIWNLAKVRTAYLHIDYNNPKVKSKAEDAPEAARAASRSTGQDGSFVTETS